MRGMAAKPHDLSATGPASPLWDSSRDHICVVLRNLEVEARVGLHPWEQHPERPSRLLVSVELYAHVERDRVGAGGRPFIDYDHVRGALKSWPSRPHTPLLETLAEEVIGLCFENPVVEACRVSIVKPDIFNDAAAAGVEIYRLRPRGAH